MLWNNLVLGFLVWGLVATIGWKTLLLVELPILLVAGALGIWLFYVQHQFEDAYWERQDAWDADTAAIQGSSFYDLPRFLHWFTGNIGFHHIHHLASKIPNYRLREAFLLESGAAEGAAPVDPRELPLRAAQALGRAEAPPGRLSAAPPDRSRPDRARLFRKLAARASSEVALLRHSGSRAGSYLKRGRPLWIPSALASR